MKIIEKEKYNIQNLLPKYSISSKFEIISLDEGIICHIYNYTIFEIVNIKTHSKLYYQDFLELADNPEEYSSEKIEYLIFEDNIYISHVNKIFVIDTNDKYKTSILFDFGENYVGYLIKPANKNNFFSYFSPFNKPSFKKYSKKDLKVVNEVELKNSDLDWLYATYSPNGEYIITDNKIGIDIWDSKTGFFLEQIKFKETIEYFHALKFTSNGKFLIIAMEDISGMYDNGIICFLINFEKKNLEYIVGNKLNMSKYDYLLQTNNCWCYNISISNSNKYAFLGTDAGTMILEIETGEIIDVDFDCRRYLFDGNTNNNVLIIEKEYYSIGEIIE